MALNKVSIRRLPLTQPPIPNGGGRILGTAGELAQVVNGSEFRFLAYIEFTPNVAQLRGNHYHDQKTEILYLIAGKLNARYQDLDTDKTFEAVLEPGDLVTIAPRCAHVYYPLAYSQALEISADRYNPADTVPYEL